MGIAGGDNGDGGNDVVGDSVGDEFSDDPSSFFQCSILMFKLVLLKVIKKDFIEFEVKNFQI